MKGAAMRLSLLIGGFVCAALAVGAGAAPHPAGLGTIAGQVLAADGKPVVGAHVTAQTGEGHHLQTVDTNGQGRFWFASLPEGQYDVRASYEGRVSEWRQGVWVAPGEQTNVVLHLRPKKSP
ncbi:MAG: carboxypeptidase-like regulatory domain-containing protein [Candidatus Acidiferrales bacterium]